MNYKKIYDALIEKAKSQMLDPLDYSERHHIVPKCIGGTDDNDNLVNLTARQHFLAHWLLHKAYPDNFKLLAAWNAFNRTLDKNRRPISWLYEYARRKWIAELHKRKLTHPEWWKNWTQSSKDTVWMNNGINSIRVSENEIQKYLDDGYIKGRKSFKRSPHSAEHKEKISVGHQKRKEKGLSSARKGRKMSSETEMAGLKKMIQTRKINGSFYSDEKRAERTKLIEEKRILNSIPATCEHCGFTGNRPAMHRWHFDNCKRGNTAPR